MTKMTQEVNERQEELTNEQHRDLLAKHLDQVKSLVPSFISSIKIYLQLRLSSSDETANGVSEAQQNRDFVAKKLIENVNEIIRILKLTHYDSDNEWFDDEVTQMKQRLVSIRGNLL
jgi:hypothetical protein